MSEPRIRYEATPTQEASLQPRAVQMVLPLDWAQAIIRLQQLHNEGRTIVRVSEDERGHVRIDPA